MPSLSLRREYVYDPVLRVIHAWNGLLIVLLALSGQLASNLNLDWPVAAIWRLHYWLGLSLILGITARLVWGFTGPGPARWRALWQPARWRVAWKARRFFTAPERFGHHPLASAVYLLVYAGLLVMACTGLALAAVDQASGPLYPWLGYAVELKPWFRTPHEWLQYAFIVFVGVHLVALARHERQHGAPVAQAMVSGYQYLKEDQ
jgi:Ni/Fe-hydrogenase 1 B-type cytochrome subunit